MNLKINGEKETETFDMRDLTLMELKTIHRSLLMFAENSSNNKVRSMASTIYSAILKDRELRLNNPTDFEKIKKQNRAMMKSLNELKPVSHQFLPSLY
jgi:hypothetical protein